VSRDRGRGYEGLATRIEFEAPVAVVHFELMGLLF
jgi:hypothetical protein